MTAADGATNGGAMRSCPDCGVKPGERHEEGCDVARCKGCGAQALQCSVHRSLPMTVWTGEWPGKHEAALYDIGLNDLSMLQARGDLVWDVDAELLVRADDSAEAIVEALARVEPFPWDDDGGPVCGLCGGFSIRTGNGPIVAHQAGCLLRRAKRLAEPS